MRCFFSRFFVSWLKTPRVFGGVVNFDDPKCVFLLRLEGNYTSLGLHKKWNGWRVWGGKALVRRVWRVQYFKTTQRGEIGRSWTGAKKTDEAWTPYFWSSDFSEVFCCGGFVGMFFLTWSSCKKLKKYCFVGLCYSFALGKSQMLWKQKRGMTITQRKGWCF